MYRTSPPVVKWEILTNKIVMRTPLLLIVIGLASCSSPTPQEAAEKAIIDHENSVEGNEIQWDKFKFSTLKKDTIRFTDLNESDIILDSVEIYVEKSGDLTEESLSATSTAKVYIIGGNIKMADVYRAKADSINRVRIPISEKAKKLLDVHDSLNAAFGYRVFYKIRMSDKIIGIVSSEYCIDTTSYRVIYKKLSFTGGYKEI